MDGAAIKGVLVILLIAALIVLVVYLIVLIARALRTVEKLNTVLDDANRITSIAAEKTEAIDGVIDDATDTVHGLIDSVRGNTSTFRKLAGIGSGITSVHSVFGGRREDSGEEHKERARARKARRRRSNGENTGE